MPDPIPARVRSTGFHTPSGVGVPVLTGTELLSTSQPHNSPLRLASERDTSDSLALSRFVQRAIPSLAVNAGNPGRKVRRAALYRLRLHEPFSESNSEEIDVPTLIIYGDEDQIVRIDGSGRLSAQTGKNAERKVCPRAGHGLSPPTMRSSTRTCWRSANPDA
jgi:pimeloyl-ACP methyl ester carboxylesterase